MRKLFILAFACALALAAPSPSVAHGDFDWINKGKYRSDGGELCCGKDDCYEVAPERVEQTPYGYSLPDHKMDIPGKQVMPSEDGKYWICKVGSRMRCFFAPYNGSWRLPPLTGGDNHVPG